MVGLDFYYQNGRTTLEIRLPPEVMKSPAAMETVITQIHNTQSPDNLMQTYLDGKRPLPMSLELVSTGGEVKFYANLPSKKTKAAFKLDLYSQYPGVEVLEVPIDYTAEIPNDLKGWELMSFHMGKKKDQVYPIKTYTEFGLDKLPKEEEKVDPITPMLETLGAIGPNERLWVQIIMVPHRDQKFKQGQLRSAPTWEKAVYEEIEKILKKRSRLVKMGETEVEGMSVLTPGERETIEVMERNAAQYPYETAIRWIYAAREGHFNGDMIAPTIRTFAQYDVIGRNAIGARWRTDFNYNFISDPFGTRRKALKLEELRNYKLRRYSKYNAAAAPKIFTATELATIYHLPGQVALTPTLSRITSTRGEAPSNLPTGQL